MHFFTTKWIYRCRRAQKNLIVINKNIRGCGGSSNISSSSSSSSRRRSRRRRRSRSSITSTTTTRTIYSTTGSISTTSSSCNSSGGSSSDGNSINISSSSNDDVGGSLRQSDFYIILIHTDLLPTSKVKCLLKACSPPLLVFRVSPWFTLTPLNFIRHSHPSWWYHELFTATFRLTSSPVMGHAAISTLQNWVRKSGVTF